MTTFWINLSLHSCLCPKVCCGSKDSFAYSNQSTEVMDCNYAIPRGRKEKTLTLSKNSNWLPFPSTTDAPAWPFLILKIDLWSLRAASVSGKIRTLCPHREPLSVFARAQYILKKKRQFNFLPIFFHFHTPVSQTEPEAKLPSEEKFLLCYSQPGRITACQDFHEHVWIHEVSISVLQTCKAQIIIEFLDAKSLSIQPNKEKKNCINAATKVLDYCPCHVKVCSSLHISYMHHCTALQNCCVDAGGLDGTVRFAGE